MNYALKEPRVKHNGQSTLNSKVKKEKHHHFTVQHKKVNVDGINIFYREAGDPTAETILMLHGFPSSSHMYRNIIDGLADQYHIIAPDYPGFGFSDVPAAENFEYTFENIAQVVKQFIEKLDLSDFYLLMQDYGGPIGFRIATEHPELVKGLIIQNANAYLEGIGEWPKKMKQLAENGQFEELTKFKNHLFSAEGIKSQYLTGAANPSDIDPLSYLTDNAFFDRENVREVQSILFNNYGTNFPKYAEWQNYFRENQPRTLVIWGEHDKFFAKAGGTAFSKDLKNIETHFFDGGHFVLEEYPNEAIALIRSFLNKK